MNINLTSKQAEILKVAVTKGFLSLTDVFLAYSTEKSRQEALNRFKLAGLIEDDFIAGKFKINPEKIKEALND